MAAKFSMANTSGLFDAGSHLEASDRMQQAMEELRIKEQTKKIAKQKDAAAAAAAKKAAVAPTVIRVKKDTSFIKPEEDEEEEDQSASEQEEQDEEDVDDSDFDDEVFGDNGDDPELDRLRQARLRQLKSEFQKKQELRAKGHGEFREIVQDEFLKEVTGSDLVLVHFYHRDFERCKIMDMHLGRLAPGHVECKFLKINAEKAPFFVDKLKIRMLPTIICFKDGVAFNDRIIGFEGLVSEEEEELDTFGTRSYRQKARSDNFKTSQLARRLAEIGVIKHSDLDEDEEVEKESNVKRKEYIEDF